MSHATENPVFCARRDDGCTASHPSGKWGTMAADKAGWFHSKAEECAWCPEHLPDWVPAWRAKQAARLHKVKGSFTRMPAVLHCAEGDPDVLRALRDVAFEHGRQSGHKVTVTTTQELTVEPVDD
jgi:hypothetical protein